MTTDLYIEDGVPITTHSMLKCMGRCPKQTQYKYVERLKKRYATARDKPLRRGTWLHELLEEYYKGNGWMTRHKMLSGKYSELMDEEKDALGDLPNECAQIMRSYLWHYGANKDDPQHGWTVKGVEMTLECPWPDGVGIYRGRVDMLVEDEFGLWIVDHKTHKTLPDSTFRLLDYQSALYIWAAREMGIPVRGFIWNYLRTKAPTIPHQNLNGALSKAAIDTDYVTYRKALTAYGMNVQDHIPKLSELKAHRWEYGKVQTSPFFRRDVLEKDDTMVDRVLAQTMLTRDRMSEYPWDQPEAVERVPDRSCTWFCDFTQLCTTELFGGNASEIRRKQFKTGDPMDYYKDRKDSDVGTD